MAYNKIRLEESIDHRGYMSYRIFINETPELIIYRSKENAETAFKSIVEFYKNPPPVKVIAEENIYSDVKI